MEEPHEGYKMVRGVRVDIKSLLTNFEKSGSVRFSSFIQEWQKKRFSLIFCRRRSLRELLEFCEEVIHIAKGYLEPPWGFPIRVGALFTLYGLFFRQPIMKSSKIRLTLPEWRNLHQFVQECKEAKHFDVCLVHYKLYIKGAYVFTAVARATGFERGYRKYAYRRKRKKTINERIVRRGNILEPELLQEMRKMEEQYREKKIKVLGSKDLDFVDHDFAGGLKKKLDDFYKKIEIEYPSAAIEELVTKEKPRLSTGPVVVENVNTKPTIEERTWKRQFQKRDRKAAEMLEALKKDEEEEEGVTPGPSSLPDIT